jgi:hypothetical protein
MERNDIVNGLRIGRPNPETDEEFMERVRDIIFNFLCLRHRRGQTIPATFEEVVGQVNAASPSIQLEQLFRLNFTDDIIESDENIGFSLTPKGIRRFNEENE